MYRVNTIPNCRKTNANHIQDAKNRCLKNADYRKIIPLRWAGLFGLWLWSFLLEFCGYLYLCYIIQNRQCLNSDLFCNGFVECVNGADEINCSCDPAAEFECPPINGRQNCIPNIWVNDGVADCTGGEDEVCRWTFHIYNTGKHERGRDTFYIL